MDKNRLENIVKNTNYLKENLDEKKIKNLNLDLLEKIAKRLYSLSDKCKECNDYLLILEENVRLLKERENLPKDIYKSNNKIISDITTHLQNQHNIIQEGYYTVMCIGLGISFGAGLGLVFGLIIFDELALGLPIGSGLGISLGVAIGANMDKKAKEEGRVI